MTYMLEDDSTSEGERHELGDIFVSTTGEGRTTDQQSQGVGRTVIDATNSESSPHGTQPDTDSESERDL